MTAHGARGRGETNTDAVPLFSFAHTRRGLRWPWTAVVGVHGYACAHDCIGPGAAGAEADPEQAEHQVRAESLLGVDVSNGSDTIGEVSDLVVTEDGRVEAVVVGVGGFLGIGEKRVALPWDSIKLTEQDGVA